MRKKLASIILSFIVVISLFPTNILIASASTNIKIGDYIQMGTYYGEPILWRCVDIDENGTLMISDKNICTKPFDAAGFNTQGSHGRGYSNIYNTDYYERLGRKANGSNYWGDSNIRCWLNSNATAGNVYYSCGNPPNETNVHNGYDDYANEAGFLTNFTKTELSAIKTVRLQSLLYVYEYSPEGADNSYNNGVIMESSISNLPDNYDDYYSEYVTDKIFIPDIKQIVSMYKNRHILGEKYFTRRTATAEAINNSEVKLHSEELIYNYWVRSPAHDSHYSGAAIANVYTQPHYDNEWCIGVCGSPSFSRGIRPAFYLNDNVTFSIGNGSENNPYKNINNIPVSSVLIMASHTKMKVNDTLHLQAQCFPFNATNKTVTWSSSDTSVVEVDNNGNLTAKKIGQATITAKSSNGKTASRIMTVIEQNVIDYDDFKYSFGNEDTSFGYPSWYKIPIERYVQAGISKEVATTFDRKWNGSCWGMSVSSVLFYKNIMREESFDPSVNAPYYFDAPNSNLLDKNEIKLREMLELFQARGQNGVYWKNFSIENVVSELDCGNPVDLHLEAIEGGAHEVVIYGYEKNNDIYTFYIYDCSNFVTSLEYMNENAWRFNYENNQFTWKRPTLIMPLNYMEYYYNELYSNNMSMFTLNNKKPYVYIVRPIETLTITNSLGQTSKISNGELLGDIGDVKLITSSCLSEEPTYTIILPTDTYTIVGSGDEVITTSFADDCMSASVTAKSSTPITISSDLKEISIDTVTGDEYDITYTTYDNIFDEMNLSGMATGTVTSKLNDADISISGVNTLAASASVSDSVVSANSDNLSNSDEITVKCEETDSVATIQMLSAGTELTEKTTLPERLTVDTPAFDLVSGTYTEGQVLNFTKDDETIIYYTTDGSIPSVDNGIIYSLPIDINKSMTVKAISTKYGYLDSEIVELNYTLPEIDMPQANVESGEYETVITVELSTGNYDDTIYYTLDGSSPFENGILYTVPINISEDTYLQAYTLRNGCISEISEYEYTVAPVYPFYFSNSLTNQDGEIITPDNIADVTKIKMTLSKLHTGDHTGVFLIAFYGADNKLIYVNYKTSTISQDIDEVEIDIVGDISSACKIKAFAWKDLSSIQPICEALEENIIIE